MAEGIKSLVGRVSLIQIRKARQLMVDRLPPNSPGQLYNGEVMGRDDDGYIRKIRVDEDGDLTIEPVSDYFHKIALGEIPNHTSIYKFGRNSSVGTSEVLIAANGYYGMPSVAYPVVVTSTSGDDNPTGNGARMIQIFGLDADFNEVDEIVTINQVSINSYIRVYRVAVLTSGNPSPITDANLGTLTVTQQTSGVIMCQILPNDGQTKVACYTIPAGYVGLMWSADTTTGEGKSAINQLKTRDNTIANGAFRVRGVRDNFENTVGQAFKIPRLYGEKTDIVFTSKSTASGTPVSASFLIELIKIV